LSHVLYCTDFSESAERAFSCVSGLAALGAGRITLLHVQDRQRIERESANMLPEYDRRDTVRLARLKERLPESSDIGIRVDYGVPAERLALAASSGEYSLLVIGTKGRSGKGNTLGGAADRIVRESHAPILLVPAGGACPVSLSA
ncbi:universal stress protein, partial [bacterium]|nr:universal stress protein [bacterium]